MVGVKSIFDFLKASHVHMKDPEYVHKTLGKISAAGAKQLQVILDFDNTMTRVHDNGMHCACSWEVLEKDDCMPQEYKDETELLKAKYFPMEIDPHMSIQDKIPMAVEWFSRAHDVLIKTGLKKHDISDMVDRSTIKFRDGMSDMLKSLHVLGVPVLVFSAGLGDLIIAVLEKQAKVYNNIKVVSNFMNFSDDGTMVGFHGELIHMYNKNERALSSSDYFDELQHHNNVILMGDNLGDLNMSDGVSGVDNILKVGFLNHYSEDRLKKYVESFDVVVVDDQTMDVGNLLVDLLK